MTIVYVTIVLSELISVVATAVVKSNKKHHLSILRHICHHSRVKNLRRLADQEIKLNTSQKDIKLSIWDSLITFHYRQF